MTRLLRLLKLALGEVGAGPWKLWPLAAGLSLGVGAWIFLLGLATGVEGSLRERVAGSLPDRVRVTSASTALGPIQLSSGLTEETVEACRAIPGVEAVYRQAHFPGPCQLFASYGGQNMVTDLILEGVDPGQVTEQVGSGYTFGESASGAPVPCMVPQVVLEILNAGIASHTSLPTLSPQALIGRTFTLRIGSSSFHPGPHDDRSAQIVGVTDQLGVSGPAVPLEVMRGWSKVPLTYHTLTLKVKDPNQIDAVVRAVHKLGLATPGIETAQRIASVVAWIKLATGLFSLCILVVAGVGVSAGLGLQVREESRWIGLYRALGATRGDILYLYLARAGVLGALGALTGLLAGLTVGWCGDLLIRNQLPEGLLGSGRIFHPGVGACLSGVGFALLISLLSGLVPARRAAALRPAEALRGA